MAGNTFETFGVLEPPKADRRLLFRIKSMLFLVSMVWASEAILSTAIIPVILPYLGMTSSVQGASSVSMLEIGILFGSKGVSQMLPKPIFGCIIPKIGPFVSLVLGLVVLSAAAVIYHLSISFSWFLLARATHGMAAALIMPASLQWLTVYLPSPEDCLLAERYLKIAVIFGLIAGPLIGGSIYHYYSSKDLVYEALSIMIMTILILVALFRAIFLRGIDPLLSYNDNDLLEDIGIDDFYTVDYDEKKHVPISSSNINATRSTGNNSNNVHESDGEFERSEAYRMRLLRARRGQDATLQPQQQPSVSLLSHACELLSDELFLFTVVARLLGSGILYSLEPAIALSLNHAFQLSPLQVGALAALQPLGYGLSYPVIQSLSTGSTSEWTIVAAGLFLLGSLAPILALSSTVIMAAAILFGIGLVVPLIESPSMLLLKQVMELRDSSGRMLTIISITEVSQSVALITGTILQCYVTQISSLFVSLFGLGLLVVGWSIPFVIMFWRSNESLQAQKMANVSVLKQAQCEANARLLGSTGWNGGDIDSPAVVNLSWEEEKDDEYHGSHWNSMSVN